MSIHATLRSTLPPRRGEKLTFDEYRMTSYDTAVDDASRARAARIVAANAIDRADARLLLEALGLDGAL